MHGANGDEACRRVRPRLEDASPGPMSHQATGNGLLHGMHSAYGNPLLPHGKLPGSPARDHIPAQPPGSLHAAPSGLLPGSLGDPRNSMHPHAAAAAAAVAAASIPASQPPIFPGIPTAAVPYAHDPTPAQSSQSLAGGPLASYPGVYRAQGGAGGMGMEMGVRGLAAQVPTANLGYPGVGALGMPGGAGMQQAAGMAQGGWMSLAAVAGQHQEAVQRAAQAQQQLAAAQQQLQRVANFQASPSKLSHLLRRCPHAHNKAEESPAVAHLHNPHGHLLPLAAVVKSSNGQQLSHGIQSTFTAQEHISFAQGSMASQQLSMISRYSACCVSGVRACTLLAAMSCRSLSVPMLQHAHEIRACLQFSPGFIRGQSLCYPSRYLGDCCLLTQGNRQLSANRKPVLLGFGPFSTPPAGMSDSAVLFTCCCPVR